MGRSVKDRIQRGQVERRDVLRRLGELAFGSVNDCVKLVMEKNPEIEGLDLSLLSEMKRYGNGAVEIRLVDRLKVLEQLAKVAGKDAKGAEEFLRAIQGVEKHGMGDTVGKAAAGDDLVDAGK